MLSLPKFKNRIGVLLLMAGDTLALGVIFYISVFLRKYIFPLLFSGLPVFPPQLAIYNWIFPVWLAIMAYEGAYSRRFAVWDEVKFLWKSSFFACVAVFSVLFISKKGPDFSRVLIITMGAVSLIVLPLLRLSIKKLIYSLGLMKRKMLIVGSGTAAESAFNAVKNEPNLGYDIAGLVDDSSAIKEMCGMKVHAKLEQIGRYIKSSGIHDVIVAKPELEKDALMKLINDIQHKAENTLYIPDFKGLAVSGTELRHFFREQTMIIEIKNNLAQPLIYVTKRTMDYVSGLLILAGLSAPMALIALAIKLSSRGPAMYTQKRVGKNGRVFRCYKFRTMYPDAEERLKVILEKDPAARLEWERFFKLKDDPRVTPIGKFLRETSLDELPQLLNILRGEMSLVGPRPVVQEEIDKYYKEESAFYFMVPPGLTGLWQISGRSNTSYDFRITMDAWYVKNWDLWLDLMILFKTVGVVLNREGAR